MMKRLRQSGVQAEAGWVIAGQFGVAMAGLLGIRLITESLEPVVYGTVALYLGAAALLQNLFCSPLIQGAFRFHSEMKTAEDLSALRRETLRNLKFSFAGLVTLVLGIGAVGSLLGVNTFWPFVVLSVLVGIEVVQSLETNLLSAARRQKSVAVWRTASAWMRPLAIVALALAMKPTAATALAAFAVGTAIPVAIVFLGPFALEGRGKGENKKSAAGSLRRGEIFRYAAPLVPLALMGWTLSLGDRYLLAGMLGPGDVAIYAAAYGLVSRPFLMVEGTFSQTLLPHLNRAVSEESRDEEKRLMRFWLGGSVLVGATGWILFDRLAGWIVPLLLAEGYRTAVSLISPIALGMIFLSVSRVFEWRLYAYKRTGTVFLGQTFGAAICLLSAFLMIGRWGAQGAAMAVPVYYASYLIIVIVANRISISSGVFSSGLAGASFREARADS